MEKSNWRLSLGVPFEASISCVKLDQWSDARDMPTYSSSESCLSILFWKIIASKVADIDHSAKRKD